MESIGGDLHQMQRTPLAAAHVEALRKAGAVAHYPAGTFLTRPGQPVDRGNGKNDHFQAFAFALDCGR